MRTSYRPIAVFVLTIFVAIGFAMTFYFGKGKFVAHQSAQGRSHRIPGNQSPISKVFAPSTAEQTAPGTGKFIIFTREQIGEDWDYVAGAWECIPSRPDVPITKRVEFCHSSWHAWPLLGAYCNVRDGSHPNFVKLQVDKHPTDCDMNLYDIDYRTWDVRCIWQGYRLKAFGVLGESVFCETDQDWLVLDIPSKEISKEVPFTPLEIDDNYWLVKKHGEVDGCWSYDTKNFEYRGHFGPVGQPKTDVLESKVSPDGETRALLMADPHPIHQSGITKGRLIIQRDGRPENQSIPVEFQYDYGSARTIGAGLQFLSPDQLYFCAWSGGKKKPSRQEWLVDIATKKISTGEELRIDKEAFHQATDDVVPVPEYLREEVAHFSGFGTSCLAPAFLMHLGILKERPKYPDCTCDVSSDGRHVLFSAKNGPLAGFLIYGDLVTKKTVQWKVPKEITPHDLHQFVWVETPE